MGIYERLGVRRLINATAELTRLGGSLMPQLVLQAMLEAAEAFVDIHDLQQKAGDRIAGLTNNEAAYITNGAATGLFLSALACVTRGDMRKIARLPDLTGMKHEVLCYGGQRNPYDLAVRQSGVKLIQVGNTIQTFDWELEAAITENTAALVFFAGAFYAKGSLSLEKTIDICHRYGVPVFVDAAAQLPPHENLWRFTRDLGADAAIFSGGKGLCGPQSSGLILGRREFIEWVRLIGAPHQRIGRPMKVGKEEMAGLVAAVEWYLSLDHVALAEEWERMVAEVIEAVRSLPGVTASRSFPSEAGQPSPRALVQLDPRVAGVSRDALISALHNGEPSIEVAPAGQDGIYVNPVKMSAAENTIVARRLAELLAPVSAVR